MEAPATSRSTPTPPRGRKPGSPRSRSPPDLSEDRPERAGPSYLARRVSGVDGSPLRVCSIGLGRVEDQLTTAQRIFQAVASSTIAGLGEEEPIPGNSWSFEQSHPPSVARRSRLPLAQDQPSRSLSRRTCGGLRVPDPRGIESIITPPGRTMVTTRGMAQRLCCVQVRWMIFLCS